jgi:hypothetical protein
MYQNEGWLTESIQISEPLTRALGFVDCDGRAPRARVLDALAKALGLPVSRLGKHGLYVLGALLEPLQKAMEQGPGSWHEDAATLRHRTIAEAAVKHLYLDEVLAAFGEFNWDRLEIPLQHPKPHEIDPAVREAFVSTLAARIYEALDVWREANVWNEQLQRG